MKAIRLLTVLLTALSLYCTQAVVSPVYAGDAGSTSDFYSGGAGGSVGLDGKEVEGDDKAGMNLNMVLLFANVMITPTFIMQCADKIDTWIYIATAVMYVAAEIMNYNAYKKQSERDMKAFKSGSAEGDQAQQQSLYEAANTTEAAAEAAERRAQAATMAMSGYYAAAGIATVMTIWSYTPWGASMTPGYPCTKGVSTSIDNLYINGDKGIHEAIAYENYGAFQDYADSSENDLEFLVRQFELQRMKSGATQQMSEETYNEIAAFYPEKKEENSFVSAFKKIGNNVADFIIPRAKADGSMLAAVGLGAVGAYIVYKASAAISKLVGSTVLRHGFTRAAYYAMMAALSQTVAGDASDAANALRQRAGQYKELAAKLGFTTYQTANMDKVDTTYELGTPDTVKIENDVPETNSCFTGSKGQLNEDSKCKCKASQNCKKSEAPRIKMANMKIPSAITSSTKTVGDGANSLFNGDLEGGLANSNAAGKNAARLRKLTIGLQDKYNKKQIAAKLKPVDFDKLQSNTRRKFLKAAMADIKNLNADALKALGDRFPAVFGEGMKVDDPNKDIKMGDTKINTGSGGSIASKSSGSKKKDPMAGFSFDLEDSEQMGINDQALADASLGEGSDEDQVEEYADDIDGDRNKNIFSLISKRYFKTAYPTFFEAKKP